MSEVILNSQQSLDAYIDHLRSQFETHKYLRVGVKNGKQRSLTQNAALHLYCTQLAQALNDAGLDFRIVLREDIEVDWTPELVKQYIWKPVQEAITGHKSTTKPKRDEYSKIYETVNRFVSSRFGLFAAWPSKDSINQQQGN